MVYKVLDKKRHKDYYMLLISADQKEEVDKVSINKEDNQAAINTTAYSKKCRELYHLNKMAFEDIILSVDYKGTSSKISTSSKIAKLLNTPKATVT